MKVINPPPQMKDLNLVEASDSLPPPWASCQCDLSNPPWASKYIKTSCTNSNLQLRTLSLAPNLIGVTSNS